MSAKSQYQIAFTPVIALKHYDFFSTRGAWPGEVEVWFAEYVHKNTELYSWRAWMIKSSETSIFDCKDPHVADMLDLFKNVGLQHILAETPGHHSTNMIWESDKRIEKKLGPPRWHYLKKYFEPRVEVLNRRLELAKLQHANAVTIKGINVLDHLESKMLKFAVELRQLGQTVDPVPGEAVIK